MDDHDREDRDTIECSIDGSESAPKETFAIKSSTPEVPFDYTYRFVYL